jgi:hypothetical protein
VVNKKQESAWELASKARTSGGGKINEFLPNYSGNIKNALEPQQMGQHLAEGVVDNVLKGIQTSLTKTSTGVISTKIEQNFSKVFQGLFDDIGTALVSHIQKGTSSLAQQIQPQLARVGSLGTQTISGPMPQPSLSMASPVITPAMQRAFSTQVGTYQNAGQYPWPGAGYSGLPSTAGPNIPANAPPAGGFAGVPAAPTVNPYAQYGGFANVPPGGSGASWWQNAGRWWNRGGQPLSTTPAAGGSGISPWVTGVGAVAGLGATGYYRGTAGAMQGERQTMIDALRLQTLIGNTQGYDSFFDPMATQKAKGESVYGYLPEQMLQAASAYLPYAPTGTNRVADRFAGFGETTGLGLQGAASFFGGMAQTGAIGGATGSESINQLTGQVAVALGGSTTARAGEMTQGIGDLVRQSQEMGVSLSPQQTKALVGYYGAAASTGMAAGQINQVLGDYNQGVSGLTGRSAGVQMMAYQALGGSRGISPAMFADVTQRGGLFVGDVGADAHGKGGRHFNTLKMISDYVNKTFAGTDAEGKAYQFAQIAGVSQPEAMAMMGLAPILTSSHADRNVNQFNKLISKYGIDLSTSQGAAASKFVGEIVANQGNKKGTDAVIEQMKQAGIKINGTSVDALVQAAAGTSKIKTKAADVQLDMNAVQQAFDDAARDVEGFDAALRKSAAFMTNLVTNSHMGSVAYGAGGLGNSALNFASGLGGQAIMQWLGKKGLTSLVTKGAGTAASTAATALGTSGAASAVATVAAPVIAFVAPVAIATGLMDWASDASMKNIPGMQSFLTAAAKGDVTHGNGPQQWHLTTDLAGFGKEVLTDGHNELEGSAISSITKTQGKWIAWLKSGGGQELGESKSDPPSKYTGSPKKPTARPTTPRASAARSTPTTPAGGARASAVSPGAHGASGTSNKGGAKVDIGDITVVIDLSGYTLEVSGGKVLFDKSPARITTPHGNVKAK